MKKLTGTTALNRRNKRKAEPEAQQEKHDKITTVATRRNVTTGTSPVPMRLPENDKAELNLWLEELSETTGKKITMPIKHNMYYICNTPIIHSSS